MDIFVLPATTIVLYLLYQVFYGLLSLYFTISNQAAPSDLSNLETKLWREDSSLANGATFFVWIARFNVLAFLVYLAFQTEWYYPVFFMGSSTNCYDINQHVHQDDFRACGAGAFRVYSSSSNWPMDVVYSLRKQAR